MYRNLWHFGSIHTKCTAYFLNFLEVTLLDHLTGFPSCQSVNIFIRKWTHRCIRGCHILKVARLRDNTRIAILWVDINVIWAFIKKAPLNYMNPQITYTIVYLTIILVSFNIKIVYNGWLMDPSVYNNLINIGFLLFKLFLSMY